MENNIIKFRVSPEALDTIEALRLDGESKHEAFRRLALSALDIAATPRPKEKKARNAGDETRATATAFIDAQIEKAIAPLTKRLDFLEEINSKLAAHSRELRCRGAGFSIDSRI